MGISESLPMTGYIKMIDIWMIFTISYPFMVITLHCFKDVAEERGKRKINVESAGNNVKKFYRPTERQGHFYMKINNNYYQ